MVNFEASFCTHFVPYTNVVLLSYDNRLQSSLWLAVHHSLSVTNIYKDIASVTGLLLPCSPSDAEYFEFLFSYYCLASLQSFTLHHLRLVCFGFLFSFVVLFIR